MFVRDALRGASKYLTQHPDEAMRAMRNAMGLRFGVPLQAFRWLIDRLLKESGAEGMTLDAIPPGLRVSGDLELMRTSLHGSATLYIERVRITGDELRIELRLEDVSLRLLTEPRTPLGALIASGSLDLSKPGNLVKHMPKLPPVVADAHDNRVVLDLMRHPKLGQNELVRRSVGLLTSLVTVRTVQTDGDHLDVELRALPDGLGRAAAAVRRHLVAPSLRRVRLFLPGARAQAGS